MFSPSSSKDSSYTVYNHSPYHSVSSWRSTVTSRRSSTSTEPNLRSIRTQDSFSLQCSLGHADSGEEFGFKDIVVGVGGIFVAGTGGRGVHTKLTFVAYM